MKIYPASKVKHAHKWRALRDRGVNIIATWIDEAELGQTKDVVDLARRCIDEVKSANILLLYCEPGDIFKGAFIETGAALASGVPVHYVGEGVRLVSVFEYHPLWKKFPTIEAALGL